MNPNQGREAAYVTSRVKDLSLITNAPDYVGLFACITPKAHSSLEESENVTYLDMNGNPTDDKREENKVYLPQLVRDVDTLTELFGDPRIDPKTYSDLYSVRYIIQNGFACYVAKVKSGTPYQAKVDADNLFNYSTGVDDLYNDQLDNPSLSSLKDKLQHLLMFTANSSLVGENYLSIRLIPIKPFSLNQVVLEVSFQNRATSDSDLVEVSSTRVSLSLDLKNSDLISTINSYLGGDVVLNLPEFLDDSSFATVTDANELIESDNGDYFCLANVLLYVCGVYSLIPDTSDPSEITNQDLLAENLILTEKEIDGSLKRGLSALPEWTSLYINSKETFTCGVEKIVDSSLHVTQNDYVRSFGLYNDPKYAGCFISELSSNVTKQTEESKDIYAPSSFAEVTEATQGKRYYVKVVEYELPVLDNLTLLSEESDPMSQTGTKKMYTREVEGDNYVYTEITDIPSTDPPTIYVMKDASSVPPATEPSSITVDDSAYEVRDPGVNDTYTKAPYIAVGYSMYLSGKEIDRGSTEAQTKLTAIKSAMEADTALYYVLVDGSYEVVVFTDTSVTPSVEGNDKNIIVSMIEMSSDNRRGLHYIIKQLAALRKDLTCIFTTPYHPEENGDEGIFDLNKACNWVAARGDYSDLFEYGNSQAVDYSEQAFYCEMYWSWVKWRAVKLVNGLATGSSAINIPATCFVILNSLASYRSKGSFYPVAGDQGGVLPDSCTILQNPSTKSQRDKLISYRINPIYDTGLRGIQIYGNDTLNPQYTDLSAAHIARTLVQIRSQVDRYSETIKFKLNDIYTWSSWISYVSTKILEPIKSLGGLQWYQVDMGYNTTTRAEISQRKIRGMISLQFTQALEIIDLEFVVYSSELDMET